MIAFFNRTISLCFRLGPSAAVGSRQATAELVSYKAEVVIVHSSGSVFLANVTSLVKDKDSIFANIHRQVELAMQLRP